MTYQKVRLPLLAIAVLLIGGCAQHYTPEAFAAPYGFFSGLWHGFVLLFSITANLISWLLQLIDIQVLADIQIIGRPNTGFFYYLGFSLGLLFAPR